MSVTYLFFFEIMPIAKAKNIPPMIKGKAEFKKFAIKSSLYIDIACFLDFDCKIFVKSVFASKKS